MQWKDEFVERAAAANGVPAEEMRRVLDHMAADGLLDADEDGDPVPAGPLAEMLAEAHKGAMLAQLAQRRPWRLDLGGPEVALAPGVVPCTGVLRIRRPQADPMFN